MKATVETPRRPSQRITNMDRLATEPVDAVGADSRSGLIATERIFGVVRVRLGRVKQTRGTILVDGRSQPMRVTTTTYLDGVRRVAVAGSYYQEDEVPLEAIPARSSDVTDFGRLASAAKALSSAMSEFGPKNPPSQEQITVFVSSYRHLMEWRRKAREKMVEAEGQIDVVEMKLAQIL